MKIGFLGAGKVGVSLGKYFKIKGLNLSGYYSRKLASSQFGAGFTDSKYYTSFQKFIVESDIIFITTTDNEVVNCYNKLSNFDLRGKILINTSGSISSKEFSKARELGAYSYSLHPIYPFPDKETSYKNLNQAVFTLEGQAEKLNIIYEIITSLGNDVVILNGDKTTYHLACVMASNLMLALTSKAINYLKLLGFTEESAISILIPLIKSNFQSIEQVGLVNSLTGPVLRYDSLTIKKHLEVINLEDAQFYKDLSLELLSLAIKKNGENQGYAELKRILGGINL
ncbi:Predicted oxidoreductase, contains short-chain dehydrogenase (SDR) and DUF2520 domains [Clostridium cavendishii DSM 21758]|uniref:Predicted oxidoreductase, contains short-chain dehydrogenase (SDR) and DUF2520 domains n=1 Tax=Clostridium cavendishii DSM 21758 TaxID=1121302 RepID=A0A1M6EWV4_9CLOT|nr:Rossmann-like and DUF2520 domain-containing protein [Clostridium cavendishii]SHI89883.1 Predicted oxidoreductase, contains short-chain dehydrogenase (SDR) and DUF2520 domains [Clostridium cavendishii DSM 21758]